MTPANWIQLLAIGVTLLLFLIPIVYFAGKLVGKFETIITRLGALESKVTNFQDNYFTKVEAIERMEKTDKLHDAQWSAIDKLKKIIMKLCFKAGLNPEEQA